MRLHRFYIEKKIADEPEIIISDTDLIHQLINVFRFKIGDQIILFDGSGTESKFQIISINKKEVILKILEENKIENVSSKESVLDYHNFVSLYLSLIKKNNFELAVEKCTEIGVAEIHPVISERSEKKDLNMTRLYKIVKEVSEQSGRLTLPKVLDITDLETAVLQAVCENKFCVAFHTGETDCDSSIQSSTKKSDNFFDEKVAVFIGPEGGWTDKEVELFIKNNFQICSLGHNILRAETAAMAAVWESFHR